MFDREDLVIVFLDESQPAAKRILHGIAHIIRELRMTQAQIDADRDQVIAATQAVVDGLGAIDNELSTGTAAILAEIQALKDAHPEADTSALDAAVAAQGSAISTALANAADAANAVAAIPPSVAVPPPVLAPQPVYTVDGDTATNAEFSSAPFTTNDDPPHPLFFFSGDSPGGTANGDGTDGVYHVYTGTLIAV